MVKDNVTKTKGAGLQLTGVNFKILNEGKVTPERQSMMNDPTDLVIASGDGILDEVGKMDKQLEERGRELRN